MPPKSSLTSNATCDARRPLGLGRSRDKVLLSVAWLLCHALAGCQPAADRARNESKDPSALQSQGSSAESASNPTFSRTKPPSGAASKDVTSKDAATNRLDSDRNEANPKTAAVTPRHETQAEAPATGGGATKAPPAERQGAVTKEPTQDNSGGGPWLTTADLPYDYWETQFINATRVAVTHYRLEKLSGGRFSLTAKTNLQVQRGGQPIRQQISVQTIEQADGTVDSFFEEVSGDGTLSKAEGSITDNKLHLKVSNGNNTSAVTIDWPKGTWGPLGVHQVLLRKPMQSGEVRQAQVFLPQIHKVARVTLSASDEQQTTAPEGLLERLVPIDVNMQLEDQGIRSRVWANAQGQILKSVMTDGPNISSYRVSRETAERLVSQSQLDITETSSIELDEPLVDADQAQRIDYVIESKTKDPYGLLSRESNQAARSETPFRATLTVWRPVPEGPAPAGPVQTPPTAHCTAPSIMIQSDAPAIEKLAVALAGSQTDPTALALRLTEGVFKTIAKKNFSRVFDSAADVVVSREGDCTEHAVLLAALLRNRGIPARIASGLVATKSEKGTAFAYHMWTEAWLKDRWLPLDATKGTVAGCDHIKFIETALADSNPYLALLPVLNSVGQLKISVDKVTR